MKRDISRRSGHYCWTKRACS